MVWRIYIKQLLSGWLLGLHERCTPGVMRELLTKRMREPLTKCSLDPLIRCMRPLTRSACAA